MCKCGWDNTTHKQQSDVLTEALETQLRDQAIDNPEAWWDWQKTFQCCGYDNNTIPAPLATGKYCTSSELTSLRCFIFFLFFCFFLAATITIQTSKKTTKNEK